MEELIAMPPSWSHSPTRFWGGRLSVRAFSCLSPGILGQVSHAPGVVSLLVVLAAKMLSRLLASFSVWIVAYSELFHFSLVLRLVLVIEARARFALDGPSLLAAVGTPPSIDVVSQGMTDLSSKLKR